MQVTVELQDMHHYSYTSTIIFIILLVICLLAFILKFLIKKNETTQPIEVHIAKDSNAIKRKYLKILDELLNQVKNEGITKRKAYQALSEDVRLFIYELTSIKVQNYALSEIKSLNMPILYELVSKYYNPEFAKISEGNIVEDIAQARKVIEQWN